MSLIFAFYNHWLHTTSTFSFVCSEVFILAAMSLMIGICLYGVRRLNWLSNIPFSKIRSAAQGYVHLQGRGTNTEGKHITAPLTGKPCIWWSYTMSQVFGINDNPPEEERDLFLSKSSNELIQLNDDTGICMIDPVFAEVTPAITEVWYGETTDPNEKCSRYHASWKFVESRINTHDDLYAAGLFHTSDGRPDSRQIDDAVRQLLMKWKQNQTELVRRFDTNHDGQVDMQEWDIARNEARREILDHAENTASHPPVNVLTHPSDARLLVLDATSQIRQISNFKRIVVAALCFAAVYAALGIYMLAQRFSNPVTQSEAKAP